MYANLYMTCEDHVFVANLVIIDLTREMVASNVISQTTSAVAKLSTIAKICKYKKFHEGHHFILMAMEVQGAPRHYMNHFFKECACLFHNRQFGGH